MTRPSIADYATHDESEFPHLWEGVVGAWAPCLGPSGTRLHDHSGRANWGEFVNLTAANAWTVESGLYALQGGSSVGPRVDTTFLIPATNFTYDVWCRPTWSALLSRPCGDTDATSGLTGTSLVAGIVAGYYCVMRQGVNTGVGDLSGGTRRLDQWQHVAASMSSNAGASLYVDGVQVATNATYKSITPYGLGWKILSDDTARTFFLGQVASSFIWDRVLSPNEIAEIYQIGPGGPFARRRRRRAYFGPLFQAAWARGSNVLLQPCGVSQ